MAASLNPKPSFTPPGVIWTVHQLAVHAAPALDVHIRRMQRMRLKIATMLDERSWNTTQNEEATAILDALARLGGGSTPVKNPTRAATKAANS